MTADIAALVAAGDYRAAQAALGVTVDGIWGPRSRAAYEAWRAARPQRITRAPASVALRTMQSWVDRRVRETSHNRGRWVTAIATYGGRDPSSDGAWCAWGVSAALLIAADATGTRLVTSIDGAVRSIWQENAGARVTVPEPGDIGIRARVASEVPDFASGSPLGHCWLVTRVEGDTCHTLECNTSPAGSREGDGCYARTISMDDDRIVGWIRPTWSEA